jgi:hypothetical protein
MLTKGSFTLLKFRRTILSDFLIAGVQKWERSARMKRYNHNEIAVDKSISSAIFIAYNNG